MPDHTRLPGPLDPLRIDTARDFDVFDALNDLGISLGVSSIDNTQPEVVIIGPYTFNFAPIFNGRVQCVITVKLANEDFERYVMIPNRDDLLQFMPHLLEEDALDRYFTKNHWDYDVEDV